MGLLPRGSRFRPRLLARVLACIGGCLRVAARDKGPSPYMTRMGRRTCGSLGSLCGRSNGLRSLALLVLSVDGWVTELGSVGTGEYRAIGWATSFSCVEGAPGTDGAVPGVFQAKSVGSSAGGSASGAVEREVSGSRLGIG